MHKFNDDLELNFENHDMNIERRMMERNFNSSNFTGEITGQLFDKSTQLGFGMPLRPLGYLREEHTKNNFVSNPHLDFDLYDSKFNLDVSYYDPLNDEPQSNFSEIYSLNVKYDDERVFSSIINTFTINFSNNFRELMGEKSILISPFAVTQVLSVLYKESKDTTRDMLGKLFNLPPDNTLKLFLKFSKHVKNVKLHNIMLVPSTYNIAFNKYDNVLIIAKHNNKPNEVNKYIEENTKGIVKNAFEEKMFHTRNNLLIMSTFTFYSKWKYSFSQKYTRVEDFYGITKKVTMMTMTDIELMYNEDTQNKILEMDFRDGNLSMVFVLPKNGKLDISYEQFAYYVSRLEPTYFKLVRIPKINQQKKFKFNNVLKNMGLNKLFENMDLPEISNILQQNCILVNEDGLKEGKMLNRFKKSNQFIADRPFNYYVRYKPMNILLCVGIFQ